MKIKLFFLFVILFSSQTNAQTLNPTANISTSGTVDTFIGGYTFSYATAGTPWNGALISFGGFSNQYDCQISTDYGPNGGSHISFRTRNGDIGQWNSWNELASRGVNTFFGNQIINGNVGIGTATPNSKLTIKSGSSGVSINPGVNPYFGTLAFNRESGTGEIFDANGQAFQINNGGPDKNLHFQVYNGNGSQITDNALVISGTNGNVGIGTANPTAKLTVAGDINSREVRVTVDAGADFVFEKEYNLPLLSSLDAYIKENKHLPGVASAKEMQTNGMNLSEMNIKLLQKVEELTLYAIEQNKVIEELKAQVTALMAKKQ